MNKEEYEIIQSELTRLMDAEKMKREYLNAKKREVYKMAVKACKSVLSNHNPTLKIKEN